MLSDLLKRRSVRWLLILAAILLLRLFGVIQPIESLIVSIIKPIQGPIYSLGSKINSWYSDQGSGKTIINLNDQAEEIRQLIIENAQLKVLAQENEELRGQLEFTENFNFETISTRIIGRSQQADLHTLILDKGLKDGLSLKSPAVASGGVIIGRLIDVKQSTSELLLVQDSRSQLAAAIQNNDNTVGLVAGERGLSMRLELIPRAAEVEVGQVVVTSGLEEFVPAGLVIGKVVRVFADNNDFFQTAIIESLVSVNELRIVAILKNSNDI